MTHYTTHTVLPPYNATPESRRRAELSDEWLDASPERKEAILAEWEALNTGKVQVMGARG